MANILVLICQSTEPILPIANPIPINAPVITARHAPAFNSFSTGISTSGNSAETSNSTDADIRSKACAFFFKALALRFAPQPANALPIPDSRSPKPARGFANISNTSRAFLAVSSIPIPKAAANTFPRSIPLNVSIIFAPNFLAPSRILSNASSIFVSSIASLEPVNNPFTTSIVLEIIAEMPFIKPCTTF